MKAIVFNKKLYIDKNFPKPRLRQGDALVRVLISGVCRTDMEIKKGYMGFSGIPGHEFVGVVEKSSNKKLVGKRIVGDINCSCGKCRYCKSGLATHCPNRTVLGILNRNGAFAEHLTLPEENLHLIPDDITDEQAVFTEPLGAAFRITEQIRLGKSDRVVVLDDGKLGLLIAQVLRLKTENLVLVGKHENKLDIVKRMKVNTCLLRNFRDKDVGVVIECTGSPKGLNKAIGIVKPCGQIVLKSTYEPS